MPVPEIIDIWRERKRWPHHAKYAFLGRAVGDVGRSLFPDEWTGEEPLSSPPDEPEHCSQPNAAAARFEKVMVEIASAALAEQLMVFTRSAKGGEMAASPAVHWNTEILRPRFQRGQIDLADPFEPNPSWRDRHWIFVSEESLAKFTKSLKSKPASSNQDLRRARQYLQPIMASAKPAKMTRADLILQCAETQRVGKSAARKAYEYLLPDADQSWRKMGRPPKLVG